MRELESIGLRFKPYNREQDNREASEAGQLTPGRSPTSTKLPILEENNHFNGSVETAPLLPREGEGEADVTVRVEEEGERESVAQRAGKEVDREGEEESAVTDEAKAGGDKSATVQAPVKEEEEEGEEEEPATTAIKSDHEDQQTLSTAAASERGGEREQGREDGEEEQDREAGEGEREKETAPAPEHHSLPSKEDGSAVGVREQWLEERTGEGGSEGAVNGDEKES